MKTKSKYCFPVILLLIICGLNSCRVASKQDAMLNRSALYDPPMVSLIEGQTYHFAEGDLKGTGQYYHSDYSFQNAFLLGLKPPPPNLK